MLHTKIGFFINQQIRNKFKIDISISAKFMQNHVKTHTSSEGVLVHGTERKKKHEA
jgi:hypothetical protein